MGRAGIVIPRSTRAVRALIQPRGAILGAGSSLEEGRLPADGLASTGVEDQLPLRVMIAMRVAVFVPEIEQTVERSGNLIEGAALSHGFTRGRINAAETEIVLDEAQHRGLIRHRVIDIVLPCKR